VEVFDVTEVNRKKDQGFERSERTGRFKEKLIISFVIVTRCTVCYVSRDCYCSGFDLLAETVKFGVRQQRGELVRSRYK
jgi:hypothetical protein